MVFKIHGIERAGEHALYDEKHSNQRIHENPRQTTRELADELSFVDCSRRSPFNGKGSKIRSMATTCFEPK